MGSHRVGHDWSNLAAAAAAIIITQKPSYAAAIVRRWVEVELAYENSWYTYISSQLCFQWQYTGSLNLAAVRLFTAWKLTNITNQPLSPCSTQTQMLNIYQHATGYQGTQDATKSAFPQLQGHVGTRRPSRSKVTTHQAGGKKQIFFLPWPCSLHTHLPLWQCFRCNIYCQRIFPGIISTPPPFWIFLGSFIVRNRNKLC